MTLPKISNRVKVALTQAPGTGTLSLGAAVSGFQTFDQGGFLNGDTVSYVIEDGAAWEIGTGVYTTSGATLTRNVLSSSNTDGSAINASASATVYNTLLAANAGFNGALTLGGTAVSSTNALPVTGTVAISNPVTSVSVNNTTASPVPVNQNGVSSWIEFTAATANQTLTGVTRATPAAGLTFMVHLFATTTFLYAYLQGSMDGTNWTNIRTISATTGYQVLAVDAVMNYYRVQYVNYTSAQGTNFYVHTSFTNSTFDLTLTTSTSITNTPSVAQIQGTGWTETSTALAAAATYTGSSRGASYASGSSQTYSTFFAMIYSDQPVTARLEMQDSGGTWYPCTNNVGFTGYRTLQSPALAANLRVVVINGATAQTLFTARTGFSRTGSIN